MTKRVRRKKALANPIGLNPFNVDLRAPALVRLKVGRYYVQLTSEPDRRRMLVCIREPAEAGQLLFVGVTDPINPKVDSPEEVRDRVLEAAVLIPIESLGTTAARAAVLRHNLRGMTGRVNQPCRASPSSASKTC
jgi:hypothetical protein